MEALATEIAPFGIKTMLVEPGFFRTELLTPQSTNYAEPSIDDYAERTRAPSRPGRAWTASRAAIPPSSPTHWSSSSPSTTRPLRFAAGADAVELFESKAQTLLDQANAHRALSTSLAHDEI